MEQRRLSLWLVDLKYIRSLARANDHVMSVSPQIGKSTRPFLGVIVLCGEKQYCVPLSSPKPKHNSMKNDVDFMKIYDGENLIGVLNFNNMIPVNDDVIVPFDMKPHEQDSPETLRYKKLTAKQITFCRKNQDVILRKANRLYQLITGEEGSSLLRKRCCDFAALEEILSRYEKDRRIHD